MKPNLELEGYYWVWYKDFGVPTVIELRFVTWDHTRDGDRWIMYDGDEIVEADRFFKYSFIEKIEAPEWPTSRLELKFYD